jgi:hypothetical protein
MSEHPSESIPGLLSTISSGKTKIKLVSKPHSHMDHDAIIKNIIDNFLIDQNITAQNDFVDKRPQIIQPYTSDIQNVNELNFVTTPDVNQKMTFNSIIGPSGHLIDQNIVTSGSVLVNSWGSPSALSKCLAPSQRVDVVGRDVMGPGVAVSQ